MAEANTTRSEVEKLSANRSAAFNANLNAQVRAEAGRPVEIDKSGINSVLSAYSNTDYSFAGGWVVPDDYGTRLGEPLYFRGPDHPGVATTPNDYREETMRRLAKQAEEYQSKNPRKVGEHIYVDGPDGQPSVYVEVVGTSTTYVPDIELKNPDLKKQGTPIVYDKATGTMGWAIDVPSSIESNSSTDVANQSLQVASIGIGLERGAAAATRALYTPIGDIGVYRYIGGHHLNQGAAYKTKITYALGASVVIPGDAINGKGSPHFEAHASLERWWDQYRKDGKLAGETPTNAEYGKALKKSLTDAGISPKDARILEAVARNERLSNGLDENAKVPRVPNRFNQPGRNSVNQDLWRARDLATKFKWAGRGMMVVGAVQDGASLYSEYQKSQSTGNYSNTYNEAARIAGGWSGAWAGGQALGAVGATWGLAFGPVGGVVGGALGGLIGGGLGYWGGSTLGSQLVPKN